MALHSQRPDNRNCGGRLPGVARGSEHQIDGRFAVGFGRGRLGELVYVQRLTGLPAHRAEIAHASEKIVFRRRDADKLTDDAGFGNHPIVLSRHEPPGRNSARNPARRFTITRRREKNVARCDLHHAAAGCLHPDRSGVARQFEGANVTLIPPHDRNRIFSSDGTRRKAEVRLRLAGRTPPVILLDVLTRAVPTTVTVRAEGRRRRRCLSGNGQMDALNLAGVRDPQNLAISSSCAGVRFVERWAGWPGLYTCAPIGPAMLSILLRLAPANSELANYGT